MRTTNNFLLTVLAVAFIFVGHACKKAEVQEEAIRFTTDAPADTKSLGSNHIVWIAVESAMPKGGVDIQYTLAGEADNLLIPQGPAISTKSKSVSIILMNLPRQKYCVCTITVRSKTKSANSATASFRIIYK